MLSLIIDWHTPALVDHSTGGNKADRNSGPLSTTRKPWKKLAQATWSTASAYRHGMWVPKSNAKIVVCGNMYFVWEFSGKTPMDTNVMCAILWESSPPMITTKHIKPSPLTPLLFLSTVSDYWPFPSQSFEVPRMQHKRKKQQNWRWPKMKKLKFVKKRMTFLTLVCKWLCDVCPHLYTCDYILIFQRFRILRRFFQSSWRNITAEHHRWLSRLHT